MVHDGIHESWKQYGPSFAEVAAVGEVGSTTQSRLDPSKLQPAGALAASISGRTATGPQVSPDRVMHTTEPFPGPFGSI
jgi:hypothetical protein